MSRTTKFASVCIAVMVSTICLSTSSQAAKPIDTTYVNSDAALVVVMRPKQIVNQDKGRNPFRDEMMADIKGEVGFGVDEIDQMVMQMTAGTGDVDDPRRFHPEQNAMVVFRFTREFDISEFREFPLSRYEEEKRGRETYYKPNSRHQPAFWMPDKKTLVLGSERLVVKAIDEPSSMGMIVSKLRALDADADIHFELDGIRARPLLAEMFKHGPKGGPFALLNMFDKVKRITATADLDSDMPVDAVLLANSEEDATEIKKAADALLLMMKAWWPEGKTELAKNVPDREFADAITSTIETLLAKTTIEQQEDKLIVRVRHQGGMVQLPSMFLGTLFGVRVQVEKREIKARDEAVKRAKEEEVRIRLEVEKAAAIAKERARAAEEAAARARLEAIKRAAEEKRKK